MSAHYVRLQNLSEPSEGSDTDAQLRRNKAAAWRFFPRRLATMGGIVSCLVVLFLFTGPRLPSTGIQFRTGYSAGPLLGSKEDATNLWFPPIGTNFHPKVASHDVSPTPRPRTPLFLAVTRNNAVLQQVVLSYIAGGWPREDIIIVDNSGTMDANNQRLLSQDNPFFLDYDLFRRRYGVSILQTPVLLNFAQLMNFYLRVAMVHNWRYFFWGHMDIAVLSDQAAQPYKSFHQRVLESLTDLGIHDLHAGDGAQSIETDDWAVKFFSYDWLTLVNVAAWRRIGQWDTFIPYYSSDCDAYSRAALHGFSKGDAYAGHIFDLSHTLPDVEEKFFNQASDVELNSKRYQDLFAELSALSAQTTDLDRNDWQRRYRGGQGEPWTYDPDGFQKMWWEAAGFGRQLYKQKWATDECRLDEHGIALADMFKGSA